MSRFKNARRRSAGLVYRAEEPVLIADPPPTLIQRGGGVDSADVSGRSTLPDLKYRAFISYSHTDSSIVRWLHRAMEAYRVPKRLVGQVTSRGEVIPDRLHPIFRDRLELASAAQLFTSVVYQASTI